MNADASVFLTADRSWLATPWAGALMDFLIDPVADLDPSAMPDWPDWAPLELALSVPALRRRLGRFLLPDPPGALAALLLDCQMPRRRLALIPAAEAMCLMQLAAAWWHAPRLAGLLQSTDVEGARTALGPAAFAFGLGAGRLLPRPASALVKALDDRAAPAPPDWIASGVTVFALAMGNPADAIRHRLCLRRPATVWQHVAASYRDDAAGGAAFSALQRLVREAAPVWSNWLH